MFEKMNNLVYNNNMCEIKLNPNERLDDLNLDNLKIIQNKKYFCFGIDSVLLANIVESKSTASVILDLCSGGGIIPILLTRKVSYKKILAVELQPQMYDLLQRNISLNSLKDDILAINADIKDTKKIKEAICRVSNKDKVDIITVNPPYKSKNTGYITENEVKYHARYEIDCTLEDVFSISSSLLNDGGMLYMVHKPERLVDLLSLARKYKLEAKKLRIIYPRKNQKSSIVLIKYVKNGGNELRIMPPLIEYDDNGNYTEDIFKS